MEVASFSTKGITDFTLSREQCVSCRFFGLKTLKLEMHTHKGKGLPQQAEVAQGVPGRLRPRIF